MDAHLPEDGGDFTRSRHGVGFSFCDVEAFPSSEVRDRRRAAASGPEFGEGRDLRVFADDRAADRFQRDVLAIVAACPEQEKDGATWRHEVRSSHLGGDASFTAVQSFFTYDDRPVLGANFWEVVRVGNAVLLTASGGEYDPTTTLDPGIRDHAGDVAPIVEEMCVFAVDPCSGSPDSVVTLGPEGVFDLRLGMTAAEVAATGQAQSIDGSAHDGWAPGCRVVFLGRRDGSIDGRISPRQGLEQIIATRSMVTIHGLRIGSTRGDVRAALPDAAMTGRTQVRFRASAAAVYEFTVGAGKVTGIELRLNEQHCAI